MLTRRALLVLSTASAALLAFAPLARAQGAGEASSFIQNFGTQMIGVVNAPGSAADKRRQMQPLIDAAVDINGIAQFCLGRFWRTATPEQQARYVQLFHEVLLNNITGKLGEFQGVTFVMTNTSQRESDWYVGTLIHRPNQQPNNVQWVVNTASGRPRIADVVAEGTSLRLTQRSDYASYLARNGNNVDALITAMQRQVGA